MSQTIAEEYPTKSNHLITNWLQFWLESAPLCRNESCYTKHDETLVIKLILGIFKV